jgi:hypothetical protein
MKVNKVDYNSNEDDYKIIGLNAFFDTEDDINIDWKNYFSLTID